ncbi:hypothetical protein HDV01_001947 [Terramyces sp. JEL0728]|nr:hypothetical protein HDV01_001947 [Terramyces sp. JEL0728]
MGQEVVKIVIVGFGMAAGNFIERLLEYDSCKRYEILVYGEESHVGYYRVALSSYFETRDCTSLYMKQHEWLDSHDEIQLQYSTNSLVTRIDHKHKLVYTTEEIRSYDILVLATGSVPFVPPDIDMNINGIFVFRTIENVQDMIVYSRSMKTVKTVRRAVVVGGGLLGLEAANAFLKLAVFDQVLVLERSPHILSRQIDLESAKIVTLKIEALGISIKQNASIDRIETTNGKIVGLFLKGGEYYDCQMLCFAVGVRPRDHVARQAGINCHQNGGILINSHLQTSIKDVYAIGECANFNDKCYGLYSPGFQMGDILAFNLTRDIKKSFLEPDMSTKLKLLGVNVASFGDYFADKRKNVKTMIYKDPFGKIYKKLIFTHDGKYLLGGILIGDIRDYFKLASLAKSKAELPDPAQLLRKPNIVCKHFNLSELLTFVMKQHLNSRSNAAKHKELEGCACNQLIDLVLNNMNQINAKL